MIGPRAEARAPGEPSVSSLAYSEHRVGSAARLAHGAGNVRAKGLEQLGKLVFPDIVEPDRFGHGAGPLDAHGVVMRARLLGRLS